MAEPSTNSAVVEDSKASTSSPGYLRAARVRELGRIFQFLDGDRDGLLTADEAVTFATAAGLPADDKFFVALDARVPAEFAARSGYDFDSLLEAVTEQLRTRDLTERDLRLLFEQYERLPVQPTWVPGSGLVVPPPERGRIPAYSLRHVLAGIPTAHATELSNREVDAIFKDLRIEERDRASYEAVMNALRGGFRV